MDILTTDQELNTYLEERLKTLPSELKIALNDESLYDSVSNLVAEYELSEEEVEGIKNEIRLILMRIEPREELAANLTIEYGLDLKRAIELAKKLDAEILSDLKPFLTKIPDDETGLQEEQEDKPVKNPGELPKGKQEEYERLHLRPEEQERLAASSQTKPLTREDILKSLSPKRTMQGDIESIKNKQPDDTKPNDKGGNEKKG